MNTDNLTNIYAGWQTITPSKSCVSQQKLSLRGFANTITPL